MARRKPRRALGKGIDALIPRTPRKAAAIVRAEGLAPFGGAWAVGDDEDGFCALGPKRATRAEAARDFPGTLAKADLGYSEITIELAPQILAALEEMHASGLFGLTLHAVLEELVRKGIRAAIVEGWARPPAGMVVSEGALMLRRRVRKGPRRRK